MTKIVTNNPEDNYSAALNLFYIGADKKVFVRGGGEPPEYPDVSLEDFIRSIAKNHKLGIDTEMSDRDLDEMLADFLMDGTETMEGLVATLYTAGWAFATLREKLKFYEEAEENEEE